MLCWQGRGGGGGVLVRCWHRRLGRPLGPEQGLRGEAVSSPSPERLTPWAGVGSWPLRAITCSGSMEHARKTGAGPWEGPLGEQIRREPLLRPLSLPLRKATALLWSKLALQPLNQK